MVEIVSPLVDKQTLILSEKVVEWLVIHDWSNLHKRDVLCVDGKHQSGASRPQLKP
jgi:hypothetical protein